MTATSSTEQIAPRELDGSPCVTGLVDVDEWDETHECPREINDPPICDLGPPFRKGELT